MKVGETYASHMTQFSTLAEVVSAAFGGKNTKAKPEYTERLDEADPAFFAQRVNQLFSGG